MMTTVKAYKGFQTDLTCRGYQFVEGETFTHDGDVNVCHSGFHAVTQPIDVFAYYPPATSVYHEVELQDVTTGNDGDSKVAARVVKVGPRIELPALIKAQVDFVFAGAKKPAKGGSSTGYQGAASSTGYQGAASSTGDRGAALTTGTDGRASATGDQSIAIAAGYIGAAKGAVGCWIVLTERDDDYTILGIQALKVDGEQILADTYYTLRGGKVVTA